ncbi:hypothetical protein MIDIC_570002 [Alphaproteobacteria bacterium]
MRWSKVGIWQMIFNTPAVDEDTEWNARFYNDQGASTCSLVRERNIGNGT